MISFSANVKRELCRTAPGAKCCALAEMLGALLYANHFSASCIRIVTENPEFAARLPRLLQRGFGLRFDALPEPEAQGKRVLVLEDPEKISHVFTLCGFSAESSLALHVNLALLENDCCRRAFLRGAFLAGGSVTDPAKRYHLEFSTSHRRVCAETGTLLLEMGLTPKQTERKGSSILYFKQSETIEELLALMGAPVSAMTVMQAKIEKDWRNDANRKTNCDTANVTKAVDAAQEQLAALRQLAGENGDLAGVLYLGSVPERTTDVHAVLDSLPEQPWQFVADIPADRWVTAPGGGRELYCIFAVRREDTLFVYEKQDPQYPNETGKELYGRQGGQPILLLCNGSREDTDTMVTVYCSTGRPLDWNPQLSAETSRPVPVEGVDDFSQHPTPGAAP